MSDTRNIEAICEDILARSQASAESGSRPLRSDRMLLEHRELRLALTTLLEEYRGYQSVHKHLVRLVKRALEAFSRLTNGQRYWTESLPPNAKTSLVLLNAFMRSNAR